MSMSTEAEKMFEKETKLSESYNARTFPHFDKKHRYR